TRAGSGDDTVHQRTRPNSTGGDRLYGLTLGRLDDGKAQAHVPISFLDKKCKPIGARSGYSRASLFLPGHLIPTTFFNDFSSLPAAYFPEFFKFLFIVRLLH